jgi:hypothetical protein
MFLNSRCWRSWLVLAAVVMLGVAALAETPDRYFAPQATDAIKVDGNLQDWPATAKEVLIDQNHLAGGSCDTYNGEKDYQARLRLAYDEKYLYLALAVQDDSVVLKTRDTADPKGFWNQDGGGIYLDTPACNVAAGRYATRPTRAWQPEPILQLTPSDDPAFGASALPDSSKYACVIGKTNYVVEAAVPWESLGWQAQTGDRLFLAAILADYDRKADGKFTNLRQIMWHFPPTAAVPNSRGWAELRLVSPTGFGGELITASPAVIKGNPLSWKLMADATVPGWQVTNVALMSGDGAPLPLTKAPAKVDPAFRCTLDGSVDTRALKPGPYVLLAQATNGAKSVTTRQPMQIVDGESLLAATNAGTMPSSYYMPDPLRSGTSPITVPHKQMTHADYLDYISKACEEGWPGIAYHLNLKNTTLGGGWYLEYALRYAAYAKVTRDPVWVKRAADLFDMADMNFKAKNYEGLGWINFPQIYYLKQYMMATDTWTPQREAMVKDWLLHTWPSYPKDRGGVWYGMNNWGLSSGARSVMGAYWLGNDFPDKDKWAAHEKGTWGEFFERIKDIDENTTNYAPWDLWLTLFVLDAKGETSRLKTDPQLRALYERYMLEITPNGARPQYGSTNGWHDSPWVYMYIFERLAKITGDGRFKNQARLMWDYSVRHVEDWHQYHLCTDGSITWLTRILAEVPDDSLPAVPIEAKSQITERAAMRVLTPEERTKLQMWTETLPERVPGKIIFRSSNDPASLFAMVELNNEAGHCSARPTSLNCLMANESVLQASQGYYESDPQFHDMLQIEDLEGTQGIQPEMKITVPVFQDAKTVTYAVTQVDRFMRWPVTLRRHYLFVKDRFLWVRDEVNFNSTFFARIGPNWLSRQMNSTDGKTWTNTYFDSMPYTGLGQGNGMFRWKNNPYDLLTYFVPRPNMDLVLSDLTSHNYYMNAPLRVRQTWRGLAKEGETLTFDSLLIPHTVKYKEPNANWLAKTIQPLSTDPKGTAVLFEMPNRANVTEKILVVIGDTPFTGAGVTTDAKVAVVVWQGDKVVNWYVRQATKLQVGPAMLFSSAQPADKEQ